ncbi:MULTISPECIES: hypothetical protein [Pantoea]|uniref:hypothetical protein n=1 Tax=Pantoea TaxID=53335 RepID=UPI000A699CF8|nr:hypothetical protein [Pantoea ananatis]
MNAEVENAIRAVARKCRQEIIKATDGKPKADHDAITTAILDKHTKSITALPKYLHSKAVA